MLPARAAENYVWVLPDGLTPPPVPVGNPMSAAKVGLGESQFSDPRLSVNGSTSCATCHDPERAFTDGRSTAIGALGEPHDRNTPTLWNSAYNVSLTWLDAGLTTLEDQLKIPLTGTDPVEMGFTPALIPALVADPILRARHQLAFGSEAMSEQTIIQALASYVRTLVNTDRPFDRYFLRDDASGMTASARAGLSLFFSARLGCSACHAGAHLSGPTHAAANADGTTAAIKPVFHRTAVSDVTFPVRAPSLRFVSLTAPYMHDGSLASLEAVIQFYEGGGGHDAERLQHFALTEMERTALADFLRTL